MKKKIFLSTFTSVSLLLSPLFLSGCQPMGDVFGEPSSNRGHEVYQTYGAYGHQVKNNQGGATTGNVSRASGRAANASSGTTTAGSSTTTVRTMNKTSSSAVPVEAPTVQSAPAASNSATVPSVPTVPASAPSMVSPTVGE